MPQTQICSFCYKKGISPPHAHCLYKRKSKIITCPELLATICKYCKRSGHTPQYCPILKTKRTGNYVPISEKNTNKRLLEIAPQDTSNISHKNFKMNPEISSDYDMTDVN